MKAQKNFGASLLRTLGLLVICAVLLLHLPLSAPRLFGYQVYAITSGSMAPSIPTGSVVYVQPVDPAALQRGDVAVFQSGTQGVVTHRVLENKPQDKELITKGDANAAQDLQPVRYFSVIGTVKLHLPLLGYAALSMETMRGKLLSIAVLFAAVVLYALGNAMRQKEKNEPAETEAD